MWHSSCRHHTLTVAPLTINMSPNNHHGSQHQPTPGWWMRGAQRSTVKWFEMQIRLVLVISLRYVCFFFFFCVRLQPFSNCLHQKSKVNSYNWINYLTVYTQFLKTFFFGPLSPCFWNKISLASSWTDHCVSISCAKGQHYGVSLPMRFEDHYSELLLSHINYFSN